MKWTVTLRASPTAIRPTCAWWLPTVDPEQLLAELVEWPIAQSDLRLYFAGAGVLVVPAAGDVAAVLSQAQGGIPFGCVAQRVYLPVDAQLVPSLSDQETAALLPDDEGVYLWRPGHGVLRFDRQEVKRIEDLVRWPPAATDGEQVRRWDAAQVGETLFSQLIEISLLQRLVISQIFGEAEREIGSAAEHWDQLPPSEREGTLAKFAASGSLPSVLALVVVALLAAALFVWLAWCPLVWRIVIVASVLLLLLLLERSFYFPRTRALWQRFYDAVQKWLAPGRGQLAPTYSRGTSGGAVGPVVARSVGGSSGSLTQLGERFQTWINSTRRKISQQLASLRHREIERLLGLLDDNPEEGLRYAVPLAGQHYPRGIAPPGAQLASRTPEFSLRGLGGRGGPADIWQLPDEYRARLHQKYRELANRETQLGRRRRAAYILAELLGDLRAAAATLADGGHYREAAALYEHKLGDFRGAAECLVRGGLWLEAIAIYEKLKLFETVGELYEKLERPEDAARAYRIVVAARLSAGDYLAAAQMLETKLQAPDEALSALRLGWPDSVQAERCLRETYNLWGRLGRHSQAQRMLGELFVEHAQTLQGLLLANVFADVSQQYPDPATRREAADQVRRIASKRLGVANTAERQGLIEAVGSLDKTDRLLTRDCQRFRRQMSAAPTMLPAAPVRSKTAVRAVDVIELPTADWKTMMGWAGALYAAGWCGSELVIVRRLWDRSLVQRPTPESWNIPTLERQEILLTGSEVLNGPLLVHCVGQDPQQLYGEFSAMDQLRRREIRNVSGAHAHLVHCHLNEHGLMHFVCDTPLGLVVERHQGGMMQSVWSAERPTREIEEEESDIAAPTTKPHWLIAHNRLLFGLGRRLMIWNLGQEQESPIKLRFNQVITRLHGSRPGQSPLLAVSLESGGVLLDLSRRNGRSSLFGDELHSPLACFADNGRLFVADERCVECFEISPGLELHLRGSLPRDGIAPLAACHLPHNAQVAMLDAKRRITIYEAD